MLASLRTQSPAPQLPSGADTTHTTPRASALGLAEAARIATLRLGRF